MANIITAEQLYNKAQDSKLDSPIFEGDKISSDVVNKTMQLRQNRSKFGLNTKSLGINKEDYSPYFSSDNLIVSAESDLEEQRAQRQSAGEQLWRGFVKMGVLAGTTFADNIIGTAVGLGNVITGGEDGKSEFNDFIDNPFSRWMLELQQSAEEALPNYYIKGGEEPFKGIIPGTEGSANFWGDKVLKNLGFTIGSVAAGAVTGSALSKAVLKPMYAQIFKGLADPKKYKSVGQILSAVERGEISGLQLTDDLIKSAKSLNRATLATQIGGSTLGSIGESRVEALHASDEFIKAETAKVDELFYSGIITQEQRNQRLTEIDDQAKYLQNTVFAGNMAVLTATNMLQFKDAFAGGFRTSKGLDAGFGNYIKGKPGEYVFDEARGLAKAGRVANNLGKGLVKAQIEGLEEQSQQFISSGSKSFWGAQLDHNGAQRTADFMNAINDGFKESFGAASGWEQYFIGAFTGAIGTPTIGGKHGVTWAGGVAKDLREEFSKEKQAKEFVPKLNAAFKDMSDQYKYLTRHLKYEADKEESLADDDILSFKNAEHNQFINNVLMFAKSGKINDLTDMYEGMKNADPNDVRKLFEITKDAEGKPLEKPIDVFRNHNNNSLKKIINDRAEKLKKRTNRILELKESIDTKYANQPDKVREELLYYASSIDNVDERIKNISDKLSSKGVVINQDEIETVDIKGLKKGLEDAKINPVEHEDLLKDVADLKPLVKRRNDFARKLVQYSENPEQLEKKLTKEENKVVEEQNENSMTEFNGKTVRNKKTGQNYVIAIDDKTGDRELIPVDENGEKTEGEESIKHTVGSLNKESLLNEYDVVELTKEPETPITPTEPEETETNEDPFEGATFEEEGSNTLTEPEEPTATTEPTVKGRSERPYEQHPKFQGMQEAFENDAIESLDEVYVPIPLDLDTSNEKVAESLEDYDAASQAYGEADIASRKDVNHIVKMTEKYGGEWDAEIKDKESAEAYIKDAFRRKIWFLSDEDKLNDIDEVPSNLSDLIRDYQNGKFNKQTRLGIERWFEARGLTDEILSYNPNQTTLDLTFEEITDSRDKQKVTVEGSARTLDSLYSRLSGAQTSVTGRPPIFINNKPIWDLNYNDATKRYFRFVNNTKIAGEGYKGKIVTGAELFGDKWNEVQENMFEDILAQAAMFGNSIDTNEVKNAIRSTLFVAVINRDGRFITDDGTTNELNSDKIVYTTLPNSSHKTLAGLDKLAKDLQINEDEVITATNIYLGQRKEIQSRLDSGEEVFVDILSKSIGIQNYGYQTNNVLVALDGHEFTMSVKTQEAFYSETGETRKFKNQDSFTGVPFIEDLENGNIYQCENRKLNEQEFNILKSLLDYVMFTNKTTLVDSEGDVIFDVDNKALSVPRIFSFYLGTHKFRKDTDINSAPDLYFVRGTDGSISVNVVVGNKDNKTVKTLQIIRREGGFNVEGNNYEEFLSFLREQYHNVRNIKLDKKDGAVIVKNVTANKDRQFVEVDSITYAKPNGYKEYLVSGDDPVVRLEVNEKYQKAINEQLPAIEGQEVSLAGTLLLNQNLNFHYSGEEIKKNTVTTNANPVDDDMYRPSGEFKKEGDLKKEEAWFKSRFPNIPFHVVNRLINGKNWGQMKDAAVYIYKHAEEGTTYHEAWHTVTHVFLNEEQLNEIYDDYANRKGIEKQEWIRNGRLTEAGKKVEEALADEFMNWKLGQRTVSGKVKNFFERLLNFIKEFVGLKQFDINEIYNKIDKGYFINSQPVMALYGNPQRIPKELGLNVAQASALNKSMTLLLMQYYFNPKFPEMLNELGGEDSLNIATDDAYNTVRDFIQRQTEFYKEKGLNNNANLLQNILDNFETAKAFHKEYLANTFNVEIEDNPVTEQTQNDKMQLRSESGLKTSTKESSSKRIKLLLGTLPSVERINGEVKNKPNILGLPEICDFGKTWNVIVNKVSGSENVDDMDNALRELEAKYPEISILRKRLRINDGDNVNGAIMQLQNDFFQLARYYYDYYMDSIDFSGNNLIFNSTYNTMATRKIDEWSSTLRKSDNPDLYGEDIEGRLMYKKTQFIKKYTVITAENVKDFLDDIGIKYENFGEVLNYLKSTNKLKEFLNTAEAIRGYIRNSPNELVHHIFEDSVDVKMRGNIKYFAELEAKTNPDYIENSHYNHNGDLMYNIGLVSYFSKVTNTFNRAISFNQLLSRMPFFSPENSEYLKNSLFLRRGGMLFTETGERTGIKLSIGFHEGSKKEDGSKNLDFNKLSPGDKLRVRLNSFFKDGALFLLRPGDNDQERVIRFDGNQLISSLSINNKEHNKIFFNYLSDELYSAIQYKFSNVEIVNLKKKAFDSILLTHIKSLPESNVLKRNLENLIENINKVTEEEANNLVTAFLNREDTRVLFNSVLSNIIESETTSIMNKLNKFGLYSTAKGEFENKGLVLDSADTLETLRAKVKNYVINDTAWNIEQTKIFIGDTRQFKTVEDLFKRVSSMVSTKRPINDSANLQRWEDKHMQRTDGKKNSDSSINGMSTILTATFADIKSQARNLETLKKILGSKSKAYESYASADAQGMVSLDEFRSILFRSGQWSFGKGSMEELYQWEMQTAEGVKRPIYFDEYGKFSHYIEKRPKLVFKPQKLQYFGALAENDIPYTNIIYKLSVYPLIPSLVNKYPELKELNTKMKNQKIGIAVFESANKIGYKTTEGKAQDVKSGTYLTQNTYTKFWGIQVDNLPKQKTKVITGTQMMKQIIAGMANNGVIPPQFKSLVDEYYKLNALRIEQGKDRLRKELGLYDITIDGNYKIADFEKFKSKVLAEAKRRNMSENILDGIELMNEVKGIDVLVNREKIENLLFSLSDALVISQKRFGNSAVQASSVLIDSSLQFYDIEDPFQTGHMEILAVNFFKEFPNLQVSDINDDRLKRIIGFRIPTQGLSSIDVARIKDFLPSSMNDMVVLPEEIVAKQGGDFDFDKFNMYFPNYYATKDGPVYISWGTEEELLRGYEEYKKNRFYSAKEIDERSEFGDEGFDASQYEISFEDFKAKATLNRIQEIQSSIALDKSNQKNFLLPVDSKNLKHAAAIVTEIVNRAKTGEDNSANVDEFYKKYLDSNEARMLLSEDFVSSIGTRFQEGSQAIGVGALTSTFLIACQHHNVRIVNTYIPLEHNEENGTITLGNLLNTSGELISDLLNEWLSTFVDAPKEPHMTYLGVTMQNVNIAMYLTLAGVDPVAIGLFMNQPIVKAFYEAQTNHETLYNTSQLRQKDFKAKFVSTFIAEHKIDTEKYKEEHTWREFTIDSLKEMILNKDKNKFIYEQLQIINDLFKIQEASKLVSRGINALSIDTNGAGKNVSEMLIRMMMVDNVFNTDENGPRFVNYKEILGIDRNVGWIKPKESHNSFLHPYYKALHEMYEMYKPFIRILRDEFTMSYLRDRVNLYLNEAAGKDDIVTAIDNIKKDLFSYLLYTKRFEVDGYVYDFQNDVNELIIKGRTAKQLMEMKKKYKNNLLLKSMYPSFHKTNYYSGGLKDKVLHGDHIRYYSSKLDKIETDELTNSWNELFESEPQFAHDLLKVCIMQTGLKNSPMAFWHLIPANIFDKIMTKVLMLDEANMDKLSDRANYFEQVQRNNTNDSVITKKYYTKERGYYIKEDTTREGFKIRYSIKNLGILDFNKPKQKYFFIPLNKNLVHVYDIRKNVSLQRWFKGFPDVFNKPEYDNSIQDIEHEEIAPKQLVADTQSTINGINISSYESGLGYKLSNFANIPVNFKGKTYKSSEEAYQENKKNLPDLSDSNVLGLMQEILKAKLSQNKELISEINERGGINFLTKSSHNLIKNGKNIKNDRWTGEKGLFMQALRNAFISINNDTQQQSETNENPFEGVAFESEDNLVPLQIEKTEDLGMSVGEFMKTLSKEGRDKLRNLMNNNEIEFKCK